MGMYDKHWGYLLRSEFQTLRQALTFIDIILQLPFNKRQAKRGRGTRIYIQHWYVVVVISHSRALSFYRCFHNIKTDNFFHAYMHSPTKAFYVVEEKTKAIVLLIFFSFLSGGYFVGFNTHSNEVQNTVSKQWRTSAFQQKRQPDDTS